MKEHRTFLETELAFPLEKQNPHQYIRSHLVDAMDNAGEKNKQFIHLTVLRMYTLTPFLASLH